MNSASDENSDLPIVFSVQGTGGSPTGPEPENRVGDQNIGSRGRPVYSGLQVPGEPAIVVQKQDTLCELPVAFYNYTSRGK